jgi:hypothetical protein
MALSLLEASKHLPEGPERAVIQLYASTYHPLQVLPVQDRPNGTMRWTVEDTLDSNIGARAIGSDFTEGQGTVKPYASVTKAYGGKIKVDDKIVTEEPEAVAFYRAQQIRALARKATVDIFEGGAGTSLKGLRNWAINDYTTQNVAAGTTSGGDVLTMAIMDSAFGYADVVPGSTFIYSNWLPFLRMSQLARTNGSGQQNIVYEKNDFGVLTPFYMGIPWIVLRDGKGTDMLSTVEDGDTLTGGTACSVYIVTFGEEMVTGFQSAAPKVEGAQDATNFKTSRLDWYMGVAPVKTRSFVRVKNVKNAVS